jgi:hypothetical protein
MNKRSNTKTFHQEDSVLPLEESYEESTDPKAAVEDDDERIYNTWATLKQIAEEFGVARQVFSVSYLEFHEFVTG